MPVVQFLKVDPVWMYRFDPDDSDPTSIHSYRLPMRMQSQTSSTFTPVPPYWNVLLETLTDPASERSEVLRENRRALEGATDARGRKLEVIEMEDAWQAESRGDSFSISYINFYLANGGVVMPAYDAPGDEPARRVVERAFPDRDVVAVDVRDIAIGGGGIHCITQQQPA